MQKTCAHCACSFNAEDRTAKYCSRDCYDAVTGRPDAHDRTCTVCGKTYAAYDRGAKYCSQECYNSTRATSPRQCPKCGKWYTPKNSRVVFCSRRCSKLKGDYREPEPPVERKIAPRQPRTERICATCNVSFRPSNIGSRYCSRPCAYKASRILKQRVCKSCASLFKPSSNRHRLCDDCASKLRATRVQRPCPRCGKLFETTPGRNRQFCTKYCADTYRRGETYGKRRTKFFSPRQKDRIRKRDGFQCVLCGSSYRIQIDHTIAVRLGGSNRIENGRVLCHVCHVQKTNEDKVLIREQRRRSMEAPLIQLRLPFND